LTNLRNLLKTKLIELWRSTESMHDNVTCSQRLLLRWIYSKWRRDHSSYYRSSRSF